jgi:phage-related protein
MLAIHIASNCSHLLFISFEFLKVDNPKDMSFPKDEDKLNYNRFIEFHQLLVNLSTDNYFLFDAVLKENDFKNSIGNDIIMFFLQLIKFNIRFRKRENVEIKLKTELKKIEKEDFLNVEFKNYIELFEYLGEKQIKPL